MCWVNFIVVVESIQTLISKKDDRQFHLPSIIAVASALGMSSPTKPAAEMVSSYATPQA